MGATGDGFCGAVALINLKDWQRECGAQLARKLTGAGGVLVCSTVRVKRNAHHQGIGLPFLDPKANRREPLVIVGVDGELRTGRAGQPIAGGYARALDTEIES